MRLCHLFCPVAVAAAVLLVFEDPPAEHLAFPVATARGAARHLARLAHCREVRGLVGGVCLARREGQVVTRVARREGLLVRELGDELVVYDLEHHQAHCLNRTAPELLSMYQLLGDPGMKIR